MNALVNFLSILFANEDVTARVLGTLAFVTALSDDIKLEEEKPVMCQICTTLSVHKITEESHALFASHLLWFTHSWSLMKK